MPRQRKSGPTLAEIEKSIKAAKKTIRKLRQKRRGRVKILNGLYKAIAALSPAAPKRRRRKKHTTRGPGRPRKKK